MNDYSALRLDLGSRSYEILFGSGLLDQIGLKLASLHLGQQVAVITNETIAPIYLERILVSLRTSGFSTLAVTLPDGEAYKDWQHVHRIFDALIEHHFERSATLLALGGGVIGDMTGFAAATYLRGVSFVQVPTTLLSQVDASVGGKTGINHPRGKNLIGAFYQPKLVVIDLETLNTLDHRQRLAGMAEVIKYGIIWDEDFFGFLEENLQEILALEVGPLLQVLRRCCAIKAHVVAADERESGTRALLNLGHTFGHAIESLAGYGKILHGEAVGIGTAIATDLSRRLGLCSDEARTRIQTLLGRTGLPMVAPDWPTADYIAAMARDKKVSGGKIRLVVVEKIGQASIRSDVPVNRIEEAIAAYLPTKRKV